MNKQCGVSLRANRHKGKCSLAALGFALGLMLLCVAPSQAVYALGLGELTLNSALNEKLDAEAKLLEVRDLSESEILIELADQATFARQGVERSFFLTSLKFEVDLDARGGPVIHVTSDQPVREPFIEFIIQARWPSGRLLRQYTVLLDLPVYADDTPAPVSPVRTETLPRSDDAQTAGTQQAPASGTFNNPRSRFDGGPSGVRSGTQPSQIGSGTTYADDSYRVQSNDTLWEIALEVRPNRRVSVHQMMIALQEANPEAFIDGNINLLKSGKILRIPDSDFVASLNQSEAVREVVTQTQDWAGSRSAAPLEASNAGLDFALPEPSGEGRLSLLSPNAVSGAEAGQVSGGANTRGGSADALRSELAATEETLDKTRGENQELRKKIDSLERQIVTLESLIEVSNESLRALEVAAQNGENVEEVAEALGLDEAEELSPETLTDTLVENTEGEELASDLESDLASALESDLDAAVEGDVEGAEVEGAEAEISEIIDASVGDESAIDLEAAAETDELAAAPEPMDPTKVVLSAPKKESGLAIAAKEFGLYIGLGLLALVAAIVFFLKRRGQSDDEDFDEYLNQDFDFSDDDSGDDTDADASEFAGDDTDDDLNEAIDETEGLSEALDDAVEPETEDVVAESDIYIAYGKYDQAEDMLQKALASNPENHEARLKLMEVYASQENIDAFDPEYAALLAGAAGAGIISRAQGLRESFSSAAPFDGSVYGVTSDLLKSSQEDQTSAVELGGVSTDASSNSDITLDVGDESSLETELDLDAIDLDLGDVDGLMEDLESDLSVDLDDVDDSEASTATDTIEFDLDGLDFDSGSEQAVSGEDSHAAEPLDIELDDPVSNTLEIADDAGLNLSASDEAQSNLELDTSDLELDAPLTDSSDASDDLEQISAPEIALSSDSDASQFELESEAAVPVSGIIEKVVETDISESEFNAPSLQDELEGDLGAIDLDLDSNGDSAIDLGGLEENDLDKDHLHDVVASEKSSQGAAEDIDVGPELELPSSDGATENERDLDFESLDAGLDELGIDIENSTLNTSTFAAVDEELMGKSASSAEDELEATLAEGEQVLAELDAGEDKSDDSAKDSDFDQFDFDSDDEKAESFEEFDNFDEESHAAAESLVEDEKASSDKSENASSEAELPSIDPVSADDEDLDFLAQSDEVSTKLDLAEAYADMGDRAGAKEILEEVMVEGNDKHKAQAQEMLAKLD